MAQATGLLHETRAHSVTHRLRILQVMVQADFKLKYAGSALGYVWSVAKPLSVFTVMYLVFGRIFRLDEISEYYGIWLLIGIVLFSFFGDGTSQGMVSLVHRASLLNRLRFPRIMIPTAATLTAAMTSAINVAVVGLFIAWQGIIPKPSWLLLVPLALELYLFILGTALILGTLFIQLRDMGQVWELALQILFYATPIIYPLSYLPEWARDISSLFPFTQVLQDVRALILYEDSTGMTVTSAEALGQWGRVLPVALAIVVFGFGVTLFKRYEAGFAERT